MLHIKASAVPYLLTKMVLRKAAVALLLLRIIANRRYLSAEGLAHLRAFLSKYPLPAAMFEATERFAAALLQRVRGHAGRAAAAAASKLQDGALHRVTGTRWGALAAQLLKRIIEFVLQFMVKIDSALKGLAPFARFRVVCNVLRRKQRAAPALTRDEEDSDSQHARLLVDQVSV